MTDLIGDPLFQLNLMLWLSLPQPAGGRITPILHDAGFKAHWISPKLTLSQEIAEKLRQKGIRSNQSVAPDLMLKRSGEDQFVLVECKKSGFGLDSIKPTKQAVGLLVMQGDVLRDAAAGLRKDKWSSHLVYVVNDDDREPLSVTLHELTVAIEQAACTANDFDTWGLIQKDDGVYINFGQAPCFDNPELCGAKRVLEGRAQPLLDLIPVDITVSTPNKEAKIRLQERFRTSLMASIPRILTQEPMVIDLEQVWKRAVIVWDIWRCRDTKRYLIREAKKWFGSVLDNLEEKAKYERHVIGSRVEIAGLTDEGRRLLVKEIQSSRVRKSEILREYTQEQLNFSSDDDN
ncbi:MAG: hypothetical protein ACE3NC_00890 [Candidatus Wallacebacter cryptica]